MKLLTEIGLKYGTDKAYFHLFTEFYNDYFEKFLNRKINILEIGISDGKSLLMLRDFFPEATIYAIDIKQESINLNLDSRINTYTCDQSDSETIKKLFANIKFDIIIDDGSHLTSHQQLSLAILFPFLNQGGIYIVEDLHTSYSKNHVDTNTTTLQILEEYNRTGEIKTNDIDMEELTYINEHIDKCDIFYRDKNAIKCYACKSLNIKDLEICDRCNTLLSPDERSITAVISKKKTLLVDCFIFYNELDLLYYRLKTLYDIVDNIIIVEATRTFVGAIKPLFYQENKDRYTEFQDKIIHVVVDDLLENPDIQNNEQWKNEYIQRCAIDRGINRLKLVNEDLILICDLDEIPDIKSLLDIKKTGLNDIKYFKMDTYYYNIECKCANPTCVSKIVNFKFYKNNGSNPQKCRNYNSSNIIPNGGWHLSYFGDFNFISNKIKNFSHQELNTKEIIEKIKDNVSNNIDLFNRPTEVFVYTPKESNTYLPPNIELLDNIRN
jgi:beta-1,4-mannosyl-glycoprotein beta-1,4-N-acetylglucosaminyltransferase